MAHEKAYFVCVAQVGSNVMMIHRSSDKKLAYEVADGQPDGTGFVIEVSRNIDPGIAGGLEVEARREAEQMEGRQKADDIRDAAGAPMTQDRERSLDRKQGADTARRAADLKESGDKAVEGAAKKTENRSTQPDAAKGSKSAGSGSDGGGNVLKADTTTAPSQDVKKK